MGLLVVTDISAVMVTALNKLTEDNSHYWLHDFFHSSNLNLGGGGGGGGGRSNVIIIMTYNLQRQDSDSSFKVKHASHMFKKLINIFTLQGIMHTYITN